MPKRQTKTSKLQIRIAEEQSDMIDQAFKAYLLSLPEGEPVITKAEFIRRSLMIGAVRLAKALNSETKASNRLQD